MSGKSVRVLIAKVGLDGHDRGAKVVARALMESGMEVIYTGLRRTVEQVVDAVVQEDVDVLGLSFLAGDHMVLVPKMLNQLKEMRGGQPVILIGGIILKNEVVELERMGVDKVFGPGTFSSDIVDYLRGRFGIEDAFNA